MNVSDTQRYCDARVNLLGISWRGYLRVEISNEETMLYRYACKEMGLDCPFIVKGEKLEEVTKKALAHVREVHADDFNSIQTPAEIKQMEIALARSIRVVVS